MVSDLLRWQAAGVLLKRTQMFYCPDTDFYLYKLCNVQDS